MNGFLNYVCECCELACRVLFGCLTIGFLSAGVLYSLFLILSQFGFHLPGNL